MRSRPGWAPLRAEASDPRQAQSPNRPSGALPATAMSPPRETRTATPVDSEISRAMRSAVSAFADAPRSSSTPAGRRTVREPGSSSISAQRPMGRSSPRRASRREGQAARTSGRSRRAASPFRSSDRRARRSRGPSRPRPRERPRARGRLVEGRRLRGSASRAPSRAGTGCKPDRRRAALGGGLCGPTAMRRARRRPPGRSCQELSARTWQVVRGLRAACHDPPETATGCEVGAGAGRGRLRLGGSRRRALRGGGGHRRRRLGHSGNGRRLRRSGRKQLPCGIRVAHALRGGHDARDDADAGSSCSRRAERDPSSAPRGSVSSRYRLIAPRQLVHLELHRPPAR